MKNKLRIRDDPLHTTSWHEIKHTRSDHIEKILSWEDRKARQRLEQICRDHLEDCPFYVHHLAVGDPAREILRLVEIEKIDMIVMATRGAKAHFHFGCVAEKIVKHATVPVVTIPPITATAPAA